MLETVGKILDERTLAALDDGGEEVQ